MTRKEALRLRTIVEQAAEYLDDQTVSTAPTLLRRLKQDGQLVTAGTRINWNGTIKKAAVALWDTADNSPDSAPELWADIQYRNGYRIIPETITVTTAFADGEYGWWGDVLYKSKCNSNVYTPAQYSDNWEAVTA